MLDHLDPHLLDLTALRPGDQVDVWSHRTLLWSGTVEETAPELGVLWIREEGNGARRLLSTAEHGLTRRSPGTGVPAPCRAAGEQDLARRLG